MHLSRRHAISAILLAVGFIPATGAAQQSSEQLILGKWRHIALVRVVDGQTLAPQQFNGETIAEFHTDGTWSAIGPNTRSAGTYRWVGAELIEQTIVDSNLAIQIGVVTIRQVRVDADRLNLITVQRKEDMAKFMPPAKPGERRPNEVTVTTIFSRVPSQ
jgi:hypothetical protein